MKQRELAVRHVHSTGSRSLGTCGVPLDGKLAMVSSLMVMPNCDSA